MVHSESVFECTLMNSQRVEFILFLVLRIISLIAGFNYFFKKTLKFALLAKGCLCQRMRNPNLETIENRAKYLKHDSIGNNETTQRAFKNI